MVKDHQVTNNLLIQRHLGLLMRDVQQNFSKKMFPIVLLKCVKMTPLFSYKFVTMLNIPTSNKVWYFSKPLRKNYIGEFMSKARIILENDSSGKILNHSARKTTTTNLLNQQINPLHVQQISGHKKLESLNSYHTASISQQKKFLMLYHLVLIFLLLLQIQIKTK